MKQSITLLIILFSISAMSQTNPPQDTTARQKGLLRRLAAMSESNAKMVDTATVTSVNSKTGVVTAQDKQEGKTITFKVNAAILPKVKKGDTIYGYHEQIEGDSLNQKVIIENNQT